jgi:hypothetical protein
LSAIKRDLNIEECIQLFLKIQPDDSSLLMKFTIMMKYPTWSTFLSSSFLFNSKTAGEVTQQRQASHQRGKNTAFQLFPSLPTWIKPRMVSKTCRN